MEGKKITYRIKKESICPLCECLFRREELLTGGGRMNAGMLSDELHRHYHPTRKYGAIYPLIYPVAVCPQCWYAAYPRHFEDVGEEIKNILRERIGEHKNILKPIFSDLNFFEDRTLETGISSYILASLCYEHRKAEENPTFLRGLSFLRAGWLSQNLHALRPSENFDYIAKIFLRKASFFYNETLSNNTEIDEKMEEIFHHGPDIDNNYGRDGVLYLTGILLTKYGPRENPKKRLEVLKQARNAVSRIVGMGKSSKAKPSLLLDLSRELHKKTKKELEELTKKNG